MSAPGVAYTRSGATSPSSNFRILQYIPDLETDMEARPLSSEALYQRHGKASTKVQKLFWYILYYLQIQFRITKYLIKDCISKPGIVIIQRALSPKLVFPWNKVLMRRVYTTTKFLIWDFDDNLVNSGEITDFERQLLVKNADTIVTTGEALKATIPAMARKRVIIMPTTDGQLRNIEPESMIANRRNTYETTVELLWLATASSLPYLQDIVPHLEESGRQLQAKLNKQLVLHVVCNKPLKYKPNNFTLDNVIWTSEIACKLTLQSHIGIMPLRDTEFCRGKGGFKILQYMSAALPSIASAVGINVKYIRDSKDGYLIGPAYTCSWEQAILRLSSDWQYYRTVSKAARQRWNEQYSYHNNLHQWNEILSQQFNSKIE
ncbi:glycosyltransferase [Bifidobacterium imperatoris]|uniref:Glycosyl transferase family 1 n=1 Tax=Bifidobacterium imperatoris TaxID=2020965 RepID=A0A2N5IRG6_9BIFI|nr:glycosyltransferase [Bifidobacterium imperatoris]PLS24546.1 glycosyl transferase family 1 [Bifidobacterium imperatoris]QSY58072.1 glycosyltransferase [Bifidobacterium imperatoris]